MKFKKLLPLLLVAPLLSGCGGSLDVKEPSFKGYSKKVEFSVAYEKFEGFLKELPTKKEEAIGSFELKGQQSYKTAYTYSKHDVKRDNVTVAEAQYVYDKSNGVIEEKSKSQTRSEISCAEIKLANVAESHGESHTWNKIEKIEDSNYRRYYNHKEETIRKYSVPESYTIDNFAKSSASIESVFQFVTPAQYELLPQEEKDAISIYLDDKLLTVVREFTKESDIMSGEEKVGTKKVTETLKEQFDFASNWVAFSNETKTTTSYKESRIENLASGQSIVLEANEETVKTQKTCYEYKVEYKDVKVGSIDTSKYYVFA